MQTTLDHYNPRISRGCLLFAGTTLFVIDLADAYGGGTSPYSTSELSEFRRGC